MNLKNRLLAAALLAVSAAGCAGGQKTPTEASATVTEEASTPGGDASAGTAAAAPLTFQPVGEPGKFSVPFPAVVEPKRNAVATPSGEQIQVAGWTTNAGGVSYSITAQDYPLSLVEANPPAAFLNQGRNDVVGYLKGTVSNEEPADLKLESGDKYEGRAFQATTPSGDVKGRVYLVGQRLYTLFTLAPAGTDTSAAEQFLNGIELQNPPPPVPVKKKKTAGGSGGGGSASSANRDTTAESSGT